MNCRGLTEKECRNCGRLLPVDAFQRNHNLSSICQECRDARNVIPAPHEYKRACAFCQQRRPLAEFVVDGKMAQRCNSCRAIHKASEEERRDSALWRKRKRWRDKARRENATVVGQARIATLRAIKRGDIEKPFLCEMCGQEIPQRLLHGHHEDYSKPLDVTWLCPACHKSLHCIEKVPAIDRVAARKEGQG